MRRENQQKQQKHRPPVLFPALSAAPAPEAQVKVFSHAQVQTDEVIDWQIQRLHDHVKHLTLMLGLKVEEVNKLRNAGASVPLYNEQDTKTAIDWEKVYANGKTAGMRFVESACAPLMIETREFFNDIRAFYGEELLSRTALPNPYSLMQELQQIRKGLREFLEANAAQASQIATQQEQLERQSNEIIALRQELERSKTRERAFESQASFFWQHHQIAQSPVSRQRSFSSGAQLWRSGFSPELHDPSTTSPVFPGQNGETPTPIFSGSFVSKK